MIEIIKKYTKRREAPIGREISPPPTRLIPPPLNIFFPQAPSGQVSNEKVKILKKNFNTRKILVIQRGKDRSQYSLAYLEYKSRRLQILKKQGKHKQIASHADVLKNVCVGG